MQKFRLIKNTISLERIKLVAILTGLLFASYGLFLLSVDELIPGILWISGSMMIWIAAFMGAEWLDDALTSPSLKLPKNYGWIIFIIILLIGVFFRIYKLTEIPWGMSIDSSANTLKAFDIIRGAPYEPLFISRETMYHYFLAGFMEIFGLNILAVRATCAFFGILAIIPFYFFVRQLFDTKIALISTFFLSTSMYHITYSRSEWRCIQVPVFEAGAFFFLFKAMQEKKWWYWALAGAMVGLGLNTYDSFRFVPITIGIFILIQIFKKNFLFENWRNLIILGLCSLLFFGPLGIFAVTHWQEFAARASATFIGERIQKANSLLPLWENFSTAFLTHIYHAAGDFFDNQKPIFSPIESLFFLGGFSFLIANLRSKKVGFILLAYIVLLLPAIITYPNSQRMITAIPMTYVMDGLFLFAVIHQFGKAKLEIHWLPALPIYAAVAIFCIVWTYIVYLGPQHRVNIGYEPERLVVGLYAKSISNDQEVIIDDRFNQGQVDFVNYVPGTDPFTHRFSTFNLTRDIPFHRATEKGVTIILDDQPQNRGLVDPLKQLYPQLTVEDIPDHFHPDQTIAFAIQIPQQSLQSVHGYRISTYSTLTPGMGQHTDQSEFAFPPKKIPNDAKSAIVELEIWIEQLNQYQYQVPGGVKSFKIDGTNLSIQNNTVSMILSPGFHKLILELTSNLAQFNLFDAVGKTIPVESTFNLQNPPTVWMGIPIRLATQYWQPEWKVGENGTKINQFARPMNIVGDEQGMIYVADADNRRIVKLDSNGNPVMTWGGWGKQPGFLEHDLGLTLFQDNLIVSDRWNDRIQMWDKNGQFKGVLIEPNGVNAPRGVAALPGGSFLVTSAGDLEIREFNAAGKMISNWGKRGICPGCFTEPVGIAYDPGGFIYVTDAGKHTLQKYTREGDFIREWYLPGITWETFVVVGPDGFVYFTAPEENTIYTLAPDGYFLVYPPTLLDAYQFFPAILNHPVGITFDHQGNLLITNTWKDEVIKYQPTTKPIITGLINPTNSKPDAIASKPRISIEPTNIFLGTTESKVTSFRVGKITVTGGHFKFRLTQMSGHAAVFDCIWFIDANKKEYRFEAEDLKITQGDTFSPNPGIDGHWWLQSYATFSNGSGLVAEKGELTPVLTSTFQLPDGDYQLFLGTFDGDKVSGPFSIGVDLTQ